MSYMDTMDIIGFLADHPEFRPAPLQDLASVYFAAWNSLRHDYEPDRHLLNMFGFGRGNYHYMTVERQWQQTTGFMAKSGESLQKLDRGACARKDITEFPATPNLPHVARFDFFRTCSSLPTEVTENGAKPACGSCVRGKCTLRLPFTTGGGSGFRAGLGDYLPAPHGLAGICRAGRTNRAGADAVSGID